MHFSHFRQGRCWHRFWLPKPSQNGPKTVPRRSQEDAQGFSNSLLKMHAFQKGKKLEKSNFRKFRRPILSQHGPQEGSQEASKIDQKLQNYRLSLELALGRPPGPPKVSKNGPKIFTNHPKQVPSLFFFWQLRRFFTTCFHAFLKLNALPVHLLRQVYVFAVFWHAFSKLFLGPLFGLKIFSFLN